jgi:hypothetical protein
MGHCKKLLVLAFRSATISLGYVAGNRNSCATNLTRQVKHFLFGKARGEPINGEGHLDGTLSDLEITVGFNHKSSIPYSLFPTPWLLVVGVGDGVHVGDVEGGTLNDDVHVVDL